MDLFMINVGCFLLSLGTQTDSSGLAEFLLKFVGLTIIAFFFYKE
jgi:hypothetical protein